MSLSQVYEHYAKFNSVKPSWTWCLVIALPNYAVTRCAKNSFAIFSFAMHSQQTAIYEYGFSSKICQT